MSDSAAAGEDVPTLAEWAAARGLAHRAPSMALPKATQLMRHGFMQEVRSLASGDLPGGPGGLPGSWVAQADYVYEGRMDLERSPYTLVLVRAPESLGFVRVLCHDRGMDERDRSNPDAGREVVELDDRKVKLESEGFLHRYELETDADQDQLRVWQLFDPSLIDWLTDEAPSGFSFELQDGALACFTPGFTADAAELDGLCVAAAKVFGHIADITAKAPVSEGDSEIERELAEHPFAEPPKSTKDAAKAFRHGLTIGDRGWKLGAEAFFRAHVAAVGLTPMAVSEFRAGHIDTAFPGVPAHAAAGVLAGTSTPVTLVLSDNDNYEDMGWSVLIADVGPMQGMALASQIPRGDAAKRGALLPGSDGRSFILSTLDGGARDRKSEELQAFLATCVRIFSGQG